MNPKNKINDLALWGKPPPPFGGISIHILRILPALEENNITYQMYNFNHRRSNNPKVVNYSGKIILWFLKLFLGKSEKIHYIVTTKNGVRFLAVLFGIIRRKIIILSIHGASLHKSIQSRSLVTRLIAKYSVRYADVIIGVNSEICKLAINLGAKPRRVYNIPAFIPPRNNGEEPSYEIINYFTNKSHRLLITGALNSRNSKDLYGLWSTMEIFQRIISKYPKAGLLIVVQNSLSLQNSIILEYEREIEKRNLSSHVMVYLSQSELWPIIKISDIFLRPTLSDGDSVAIREALSFGVPVVASDCVARPSGVVTFNTGIAEDLYSTIINVIENINEIKDSISKITIDDNSKKIISIIKNLLK
jgi:glycosyltransferase involved in cell wall biosynthesis